MGEGRGGGGEWPNDSPLISTGFSAKLWQIRGQMMKKPFQACCSKREIDFLDLSILAFQGPETKD
jgi:hypothetical protein